MIDDDNQYFGACLPNMAFKTDRNISKMSDFCATCPCVRMKHRAGCPRHS